MRENVERRAAALELQPLRWPSPFPFDCDFAMLAATFAKRIGKTVAFALAAFRQAYAGGHALSVRRQRPDRGAACEIHPARDPARRRERAACARSSSARARRRSRSASIDVPAVRVGERVLVGERRARAGRRAARAGARMRAGRAYRLLVRRGGALPAALASPDRVDHVEVVEVGSGEVVLFWDCSPREASRLARALRTDLAGREAEEFIARWSRSAGARPTAASCRRSAASRAQ